MADALLALTDAELDDLEAKAKAATPGPWYVDGQWVWEITVEGGNHPEEEPHQEQHGIYKCYDGRESPTDSDLKTANYIAAANPSTTQRLVAEVKEARQAPTFGVLSDRTNRQRVVTEWGRAAFGSDQVNSPAQRALRLLEEAVELFQAADGDPTMAHKLIDFVFNRPVGDVAQEIGGVGVCLLVMASAAGLDADKTERDEIRRVMSKPTEYYTARNEKKNAAGFLAANKEEQ